MNCMCKLQDLHIHGTHAWYNVLYNLFTVPNFELQSCIDTKVNIYEHFVLFLKK